MMRENSPGVSLTHLEKILFVLLLFLCSTIAEAQPVDKPLHILFVGNSYTYINSLPQMFKSLVESQFPDLQVKVKFIGGGGATLKEHWEIGKASKEIESGNWNYVVLQGQSMLGSEDLTDPESPKQFYKYARKLDGEIKKSDSKTIFFMMWCRKYLPSQQKYLTIAYQNISNELGSLLAPAGLMWKKFEGMSGADLYGNDGSHPSKIGTFLSVLSLFDTIFHTVPKNLPGKLYGREILRGGKLSAGKICLCDLNKKLVKLLRLAVIQTMTGKKSEK